MIKKLLLTLFIGIGLAFSAMTTTYAVSTDKHQEQLSIQDKKIDIRIIKDGNMVTIEHASGYDISHAVVEYAFMENGKPISMLDTYPVNNNRFTVSSNVYAIKVHQIKTLINNTYYTYSTSNQNTAGSLVGVERRNIVEIVTKHAEVIKTNKNTGYNTSEWSKVYEFYFQFDSVHDEVDSIDVDYVFNKKVFWVISAGKINISDQNLNAKDSWTIRNQYPNPANDKNPLSYKVLERNTSKHPGNYVARIAPHADEYTNEENKKLNGATVGSKYILENFAIIRITYIVDGEFIVSDVVNDPTTPEQDSLKWFIDFINRLQASLSWLTAFFAGNSNVIFKVSIVVGALIAYAIVSPFVKIIYKIVKGLFNLLISALASIFGIFF